MPIRFLLPFGLFCAASLLAAAPPSVAAECDSIISPEAPPVFALEWGTQGTGPGQFTAPFGIGVDPWDNVWVVDRLNHNVQKFAPDGTWLATHGTYGSGPLQFLWPVSIGFDMTNGDFYVSQVGNNSVKKFDYAGNFLLSWGSLGTGDGQFDWPDGVAVGPGGDVFVADHSNDRIQKFTSTGTFLTKWGSAGDGINEFVHPHGIAITDDNEVIVADGGNHRMQVFTLDGSFLRTWGSYGNAAACAGGGQFAHTVGVCTGPAGSVYIVDSNNHRVQRTDNQGTFLSIWGFPGSLPGQFGDFPWHVASASDGSVYVVDDGNHRIQKFVIEMDPTGSGVLESSSWGRLKARYRR